MSVKPTIPIASSGNPLSMKALEKKPTPNSDSPM
jgi:hypothetical protein